MDAESGNLMEITVSDGKTVAQATDVPSRDPSRVSKMSDSKISMLEAVINCLMRKPNVRMAFSLASNNFINVLCLGSDFMWKTYCRYSFGRLTPKQGACALTYTLSTGEVLNAPKQSLIPWLSIQPR